MLKITTDNNWVPVYEALASEVRLGIIRLLAKQPMNNKEIAAQLALSGAIVSMHVRKLQEAGIIKSEMVRINAGTHKINTLAIDGIEVLFPHAHQSTRLTHENLVPIGHYSDFHAEPTCGLATVDKIIGQFDDPRYFLEPERVNAAILWMGKGYVDYKFPNYILPSQQVEEINISLELGSEAPGVNQHWPSDITFSLNGVELGTWTSPGDSGEGRGKYTPAWWNDQTNQYGFLKQIQITEAGTFVDGQQMSTVTLDSLPADRNVWSLRIEVKDGATHVGGLTLYGKGFGNYNQDIVFRTYYKTKQE